ncbi:type II toxin-antitoxin system RelE family toxin [Paenibacillus aceris]|uniref:Type II toxin-antitoxin system RelE/ParE family toxin n=1 Tax=Paenibacillus aceris TaxID=869555 RepID=A0ABS4I6B3_9BACL|nr:hypothetical protein [Paenibacillus aceris]MBP1966449.1 hypothetical protein [Paenibacillus aceris]NHW39571.1 hypothetical protein [Paenibacillus aceris]
MEKVYKVYWSQTALIELASIRAYPPEVKESIYLESIQRLSFTPTLTAKQISFGKLKGYWARLGLYQDILIFEVEEDKSIVWIDGIKHKRENMYWKK